MCIINSKINTNNVFKCLLKQKANLKLDLSPLTLALFWIYKGCLTYLSQGFSFRVE